MLRLCSTNEGVVHVACLTWCPQMNCSDGAAHGNPQANNNEVLSLLREVLRRQESLEERLDEALQPPRTNASALPPLRVRPGDSGPAELAR